MLDDTDFIEYLHLQGGKPELLTKSELVAEVRERGGAISDRQLTFYVSEGLAPKSVRVGSRAGVYPRVVADLLVWVLRCKQRGLSLDSIRELKPVWKYLVRATHEKRIDLAELEYIARQSVLSPEAVLAVPSVLTDALRGLCPDCVAETTLALKDGREVSLSSSNLTIGFGAVFSGDPAERDAGDSGGDMSWWGFTRVALPFPETDPRFDPASVILGAPPGAELPPWPQRDGHEDESPPAPKVEGGEEPASSRAVKQRGG